MGPYRIREFGFILIQILLLVNFSSALYEDQIKKFDWKRLNIGPITEAQFDPTTNGRILVSTENNVIAALCQRSGEIIWRQVMENGARGAIKLFHVTEQDITTSTIRNSANSFDILTVSGHAPALVRAWCSTTGILKWEWSLMPLQPEKAEHALWFYDNLSLYHILPIWNSHLEVTKYDAASGKSSGASSRISTPWIKESQCFLAAPYYACIDKNQLIVIDLTADNSEIVKKNLPSAPTSVPKILKNYKGVVIIDDQFVSLTKDEVKCNKKSRSTVFRSDDQTIIEGVLSDRSLQLSAFKEDSCEIVNNLQVKIDYPEEYGPPTLQAVTCRFKNGESNLMCGTFISTADGAILFFQQGKLRWSREESLSDIVSLELIDLPLSDAEGAIEKELNSKPGDVIGACIRRISTQVLLIKNIFLTVLGLGTPPTATQKAGLIRDSFGLHKMIVAVTGKGKIFGIDNITGKHHWSKYLPSITNFNNGQKMKLFIQRTSKHFPFQPVCTLVAKDIASGNGVLYQFNPISGQPVNGGLVTLSYQIKQIALLRETENDFLKGMLLLDHNNGVHVVPDVAKESAHGIYVFTADKEEAVLQGYFIELSNEKLSAVPIWRVNLGGYGNAHKITAIAAKNPIEHVHSQGRVLSDRSVLYKYINPNLVAVVTQGLDNIHKYIMNVHLLDVVSGAIVFSMTHRKVRGPVHVVHSENWLAYSYYNDKVRRTEITTVELYEGKVQANSTVWSSLDALPVPLIERQSYIIPATLEAMRETITERGITNKHVLMGLSSGGIIEMPWALLDPRRPVSTPNQVREEGSIPYIPELPLPTENTINYNQSIARIKDIYTAPSGLESTCLVVAYGLDLFVTRVSPSKTFDLLKEDFDYFLITVVLIGLTTGSFVVKHLSSRKALKQAWK